MAEKDKQADSKQEEAPKKPQGNCCGCGCVPQVKK